MIGGNHVEDLPNSVGFQCHNNINCTDFDSSVDIGDAEILISGSHDCMVSFLGSLEKLGVAKLAGKNCSH